MDWGELIGFVILGYWLGTGASVWLLAHIANWRVNGKFFDRKVETREAQLIMLLVVPLVVFLDKKCRGWLRAVVRMAVTGKKPEESPTI